MRNNITDRVLSEYDFLSLDHLVFGLLRGLILWRLGIIRCRFEVLITLKSNRKRMDHVLNLR